MFSLNVPIRCLGLVLLVANALLLGGCRPADPSAGKSRADTSSRAAHWHDQLFDYAIDAMLNRNEEFNGGEMQRQTVSRLDQWVRKQKPLEDWRPDPMLAGLSEEFARISRRMTKLVDLLAALKQPGDAQQLDKALGEAHAKVEQLAQTCTSLVARMPLADMAEMAISLGRLAEQIEQARQGLADSEESADRQAKAFLSRLEPEDFAVLGRQLKLFADELDLAKLEFSPKDGITLQELVWLRSISQWATGQEHADPLEQAGRLFDWTIRNIQPQDQVLHATPKGLVQIRQSIWDTLLLGRGTPMDRAWVFVLLARQQNIDAALLALPGKTDAQKGQLQPWVVGVLIEGKIYLFDPFRGIPLPAVDGIRMEEGRLSIRPATLTEAATDPRVLEQLDAGEEFRYPVRASDLKRVVALVEAGPAYLSQRMALVESRLSGRAKLVLTVAATRQAERFRQHPQVAEAQLWGLPFQVLIHQIRLGAERLRWQQSVLMPFGAGTATLPVLYKGRVHHLRGRLTGDPSATSFYQMARRSDFQLDSADLDAASKMVFRRAKLDASYWLGLVVAVGGNHRAAIDYLKTRTLDAAPGGPWENGAIYNLARAYEAQGNFARAIELYRSNDTAPDYHGQLLRARWLGRLTGSAPATEEGQPAKEKAAGESP